MSRYGLNYYGLTASKYGGENPVSYVATRFTAKSSTYVDNVTGIRKPKIVLEWVSPSGSWAQVKLIRNTYGYPVNAWDGKVLVDKAKEIDPTRYEDKEFIAEGAFYYYSLFVFQLESYSWVRAADAVGLSVYPFGNGNKLYEYMPAITKITQIGSPTIPSGNEDLKNFLSIFGFELDYAQTLANLLIHRYDLQRVGGQLLPVMLQQFGLSYEPEIGYQQFRILVRDAIQETKAKGSSDGLRTYMKSFSGWAVPKPIAGTPNPSIDGLVVGHNLMLDYNDSSFEESKGHWVSANSTANLYQIDGASVTRASLTSNVATLTIGTHGYLVGHKVSVTGFYQPLFNVAGFQTITATTSTTISFALTASDVAQFNTFNPSTNSYPSIKPGPSPWNEPTALPLSPNKQLGILSVRNASASSQTLKINCGSDVPETKGIPVSSSTAYTFSVYTANGGTARAVTVAIDWYTRQGTYISSSTGSPVTNSTTVFSSSYRPFVTGTSPATAYYAVPTISIASSAGSGSNEFHYFDCAQFERSATATSFDEARQVHLTMKATRINELLNPNFASPLTPWSITGATTVTDSAIIAPEEKIYSVTKKSLTSNIATLTTVLTHPYQAGQKISITGVGSPFDGVYTITSTTAKTISYSKTNADISEVSATGTVFLSGDALKLTATGTNVTVRSTTTSADLMPIHYPNTNYIFSFYMKSNSGSISVTPSISWYNSSKVLITTQTGSVNTVTATGTSWDRPYFIGLAPTTAAYAHVQISYTATVGDIAWIDEALFENNSNLLEYFDGYGGPGVSTDFYWEGGVANGSRSHYYKNAFAVQSRIFGKALSDQLILGSTLAVYLAQPKT